MPYQNQTNGTATSIAIPAPRYKTYFLETVSVDASPAIFTVTPDGTRGMPSMKAFAE